MQQAETEQVSGGESIVVNELTFEVRTELDSIVGLAELLAEELTSDESWALADLERIQRSARRVGQLIARLEGRPAPAG
ncbi:MAG TPA: hypothetical protein ENK18_16700 [Deltaproteobacteria bacterium]|nr:hypothetical protein [Deltaproteobacteria bacterium]